MSEQFERDLPQPPRPSPQPPVRYWWEQASEHDQDAVLANVRLSRSMAGVPWAFLPESVQALLVRRVRIAPREKEGGMKDEE